MLGLPYLVKPDVLKVHGMEVLDSNVQNQLLTSQKWWASSRRKYNKGLVIAGFTSFLIYAIIGNVFFADDIEFEITIFTVAFQGMGYLIMMIAATYFIT